MTKRFCLQGHDTEIVGRGSRGNCKECKRAYDRAYHAAHREERLVSHRAYRAAHPEKDLVSSRAYRTSEKGKVGRAKWLQVHPEYTSSEFAAWRNARTRVSNPNNPDWNRYGGRGIRMAAEWLGDFSAFLAHIGSKSSPDLMLDRINNDGHYEPGNVRWVTSKQSASNRTHR